MNIEFRKGQIIMYMGVETKYCGNLKNGKIRVITPNETYLGLERKYIEYCK